MNKTCETCVNLRDELCGLSRPPRGSTARCWPKVEASDWCRSYSTPEPEQTPEQRIAELERQLAEARAELQKAKEWNRLTELEVKNLRSIVSDQDEDTQKMKAQLVANHREFCDAIYTGQKNIRAAIERELDKVAAERDVTNALVEAIKQEADKLHSECIRDGETDAYCLTSERIAALAEVAKSLSPRTTENTKPQ